MVRTPQRACCCITECLPVCTCKNAGGKHSAVQQCHGLRIAQQLGKFVNAALRLTTGTSPAGRAWAASELRLKSFEDLQQIWLLCVREQNHVHTWAAWSREAQRSTSDAKKQQRYQRSPGGRLKHVRDSPHC